MNFVLKNLSHLGGASQPAAILAAILAGIALLALILLARRAWLHSRVRRYDALSFTIHTQWRSMVSGEIPAEQWRNNSVQRELLRSIVIQEIGVANEKDRASLQQFLRKNGFVESCAGRVRAGRGQKRRREMLALGAMRIPEAIAPLAEALHDWRLEMRVVAVKALGQTGLAKAAEPILETHMTRRLKVPDEVVASALVCCYQDDPMAMLPYLRRSTGDSRTLLARVAGELATPQMTDEIILLAEDPRPEVRAAAAKALAVAPLPVAIPTLAALLRDDTWFVRLRAVSTLGQLLHPRTIPILLEAIRDSNRLVRIRAATALSRFEHETVDILQRIVVSRDYYALHAMISALELGGGFGKLLAQLSDPAHQDEAALILLDALRKGSAGFWSTRPADPVVESVFP